MKNFDNSAHNCPYKIVELESVAYSGTNDFKKTVNMVKIKLFEIRI